MHMYCWMTLTILFCSSNSESRDAYSINSSLPGNDSDSVDYEPTPSSQTESTGAGVYVCVCVCLCMYTCDSLCGVLIPHFYLHLFDRLCPLLFYLNYQQLVWSIQGLPPCTRTLLLLLLLPLVPSLSCSYPHRTPNLLQSIHPRTRGSRH